jgi:hypothetical protein
MRSMIDFGPSTDSAPSTPPSPAVPTIPMTSKSAVARSERINLAHVVNKAILPFISDVAYGWKSPDGIRQASYDELNAHFQATYILDQKKFFNDDFGYARWLRQEFGQDRIHWSRMRKRLGNSAIEKHLVGQSELLVYSDWGGGRLLTRFDIDVHHGQKDSQTALSILQGYFPTRTPANRIMASACISG